jgi:hypothetical protein
VDDFLIEYLINIGILNILINGPEKKSSGMLRGVVILSACSLCLMILTAAGLCFLGGVGGTP